MMALDIGGSRSRPGWGRGCRRLVGNCGLARGRDDERVWEVRRGAIDEFAECHHQLADVLKRERDSPRLEPVSGLLLGPGRGYKLGPEESPPASGYVDPPR